MKKSITVEDHQNSKFIAEPFRLLDCCLNACHRHGRNPLVLTYTSGIRPDITTPELGFQLPHGRSCLLLHHIDTTSYRHAALNFRCRLNSVFFYQTTVLAFVPIYRIDSCQYIRSVSWASSREGYSRRVLRHTIDDDCTNLDVI